MNCLRSLAVAELETFTTMLVAAFYIISTSYASPNEVLVAVDCTATGVTALSSLAVALQASRPHPQHILMGQLAR